VAALLALALSGATVGVVAAAPPTASYTTALTVDSSCAFTLKATWKNTMIDTVYGIWYLDDVYFGTTQAPATGPNAGIIKGRTATFHVGPGTPDTASHTWRVLVQFYSGGAHQFETDATVSALCSL
jgi:hypothetical protein